MNKFIDIDDVTLIDEDPIDEECNGNGLVFKCTVNTYLSSHNSIELRKSLRLLKRKSCDCYKCTWPIWYGFLSEDIANNPKIIDRLEDGKTYRYLIESSRDFETGIYEIDKTYFDEIKN